MAYKIRISRDWEVAHRGAPSVTYKAGVYAVPDELSDEMAQRCLRSGLARIEHFPSPPEPTPSAPRRKALRGAPENKSAA